MADSDLKQFGDATRKGTDKGTRDDDILVKILDRKVALESPGSGQIGYIAMTAAGASNDLVQLGEVINFLVSLMDDEDGRYVKGLLLDRHSGFEGEDMVELAQHIVKEWSGRPTKPSSGSSARRRTNGAGSTPASPQASKRSTTPSES